MLDQMTFKLLGALEAKGYVIPSHLMPDISLGKIFSGWLRGKGHNPDSFPTYQHDFDDGRRPVVSARLYPNDLMTEFNLQLDNWITSGRALEYFSDRDVKARWWGNCVLLSDEIFGNPWHTANMPKKKDENESAFNTLQELISRDAERDGIPRPPTSPQEKVSYRVKAGRKGGKKGGNARAVKLSPKKRSQIAKKAADSRWAK